MKKTAWLGLAFILCALVSACATNPYRQGGAMCESMGACADPPAAATASSTGPAAAGGAMSVSGAPSRRSADPYEAAKKGGCISKPLDACLRNLQVAFHLTGVNDIDRQLRANEAVDVNGKRVRERRQLNLTGNLDGWAENLQLAQVEYDKDKTVYYAEMSLPGEPSSANTEDEYAKSGLYEALVLLLGSDCPDMKRLEVYRFFQNDVKPKIVNEGRRTDYNDTGIDTHYFRKAVDIPLCGRKFSYTHLFGHDTERITLENEHGAYSMTTVSVK